MNITGCKVYVIYCTLIAFIFSLSMYNVRRLRMRNNTNVTVWKRRNFIETEHARKRFMESATISTAANVIQPSSHNSNSDIIKCKTVCLFNMTFPICLHDVRIDSIVSRGLMHGKYWEVAVVSSFVRLLRLDQRLQFVDIGANIGLHSLPAARVSKVISVEPNWLSISRLAKAVDLGAVSSNITLVHNAISNVRMTAQMDVDSINQGNAFLITNNSLHVGMCKSKHGCKKLLPTRTIFLNDLLPLMQFKAAVLKVDVEGQEVNVFTEPTAAQFFDKIDVSLVFLEWFVCRNQPTHFVRRLLDFFFSRSYKVFSINNVQLAKPYKNWPPNVLFKKVPYIRF